MLSGKPRVVIVTYVAIIRIFIHCHIINRIFLSDCLTCGKNLSGSYEGENQKWYKLPKRHL